MKYLLQALESRSSRLGLNELELKQLLNDVQEGRETKGSDDWYDSLEKVVNELRTTPDAHWFLKPVSKKDVRDYHLIVKHPMDLGTVLKKVKQRVYKTKAEFKDDLDLIWDNCLLYNSSPTHPIRNVAIQMKRKADHHLDFLVDAAATQKDPLAELDFKDDDDSEEEAAAKKIKLLNGGSKAVKVVPGREKDAKDRLKKRGRADSTSSQATTRPRSPPLSTRSSLQRTAGSMVQFQELDQDLADSPYPVAGPSRIPAGPSRPQAASKPKKPTVSLKKARHSLRNVKSTPWDGPEPPPLSSSVDPLTTEVQSPATSLGEVDDDLDAKWWKHVQNDDMLRAGVPEIPQMAQDFHRRRRKGIGLSKGKGKESELSSKPQPPPPPAIPSSTDPPLLATLVNQPPPSLSAQVYQNIASLQKVQRIHSQLAALDANDPTLSPSKRAAELPPTLPYPSTEGGDEDEEEPDEVREAKRVERESRRRLPANPKARVPRRPETSSSQALEGLKLVSGTMLAHAGFEGAQQAALDTITDVTATFLANLGKALRFYVDTHGHKMTSEEMILHTLYHSGTQEVSQLELYIRDDVERHGSKLAELAKKMQAAYTETLESAVIEDDMLFADDGEMFMSNFAEDLGEDFFGFRELGLDKELGLATFSVPSRLFHGKANQGLPGPARNRPEPALEHPPPPDLVRFALSDVPLQIGLLRPFYEAEFRKLIPAPASPAHVVPASTALPTPTASTESSQAAPVPTPVEGLEAPSLPPTTLLPTPLPSAVASSHPPHTQSAPQPSLASLPLAASLPEDHFDPILLKKLTPMAQIPAAASASALAAKRKKQERVAGKSKKEPGVPAKKKSKATGVGKGNWKRPPKDPNAPPKPKKTPNKGLNAQKGGSIGDGSPLKAMTNGTTSANSAATDNPPPILLNGTLNGASSGIKREDLGGSPIKVG